MLRLPFALSLICVGVSQLWAQTGDPVEFATAESRFTWLCNEHKSNRYDVQGSGLQIIALRTFDAECRT